LIEPEQKEDSINETQTESNEDVVNKSATEVDKIEIAEADKRKAKKIKNKSKTDNKIYLYSIGSKVKKFVSKICFVLFNFYDLNDLDKKKPFMITPCNHAFHSECLKSWLKLKKECPFCRFCLISIL